MSMPGCPGDEDAQKVLDSLKAQTADLDKKVQDHTSQLLGLRKDVDEIKKILQSITNVIESYKNNFDRLIPQVNELMQKAHPQGIPKNGASAASPSHSARPQSHPAKRR